MKNIILILVFISFSNLGQAQELEIPQPSPFSKIEQMVGLTTIEIEYSRPNVKGRTIFGELVPYGKLWRTGANLNTTITFSNDVTINQKEIKKGSYAIFTIPSKTTDWELIIYDAPRGYTPKVLDDNKIIHRFKTPAKTNPNFVESFTIDIGDLKTSSASIFIKWVNTILEIPIEVNADQIAMANIENMINGPSADNLFQAAEYYFLNNKDLDVALDWAKQSGEKYTWDAYWPHYLQAKILAKKGRYTEAIVAGTRASEYVRKAGYLTMADKIDYKLKSWKAQVK